ncbi:hypothetical protein ACP70R_038582 [Stipagrostis hirtigluma subsp. patula]
MGEPPAAAAAAFEDGERERLLMSPSHPTMPSLDNDSDSGRDGSSSRKRKGSGRYTQKFFPIRDEALIQLLKAASNVITTTVTGLAIFAATIPLSWKEGVKLLTPDEKAFLIVLPFLVVPFCVMVVGWTHAAEHQYNLLSVASGLVLCEFIFTVKLLAIVAINFAILSEKFIYAIAAVVSGIILLIWSFAFSLAQMRGYFMWTKAATEDKEAEGTAQLLSSSEPMVSSAMVHALKEVSNACRSAVTAVNIFAASVPHLCENDFKHLTSGMKFLLLCLPFVFLQFAVLSVCLAHAAEHQRNLLPTARSMVLSEFVYTLGLLATVAVIFEILPVEAAWATLVVIISSFLMIWGVDVACKYIQRAAAKAEAESAATAEGNEEAARAAARAQAEAAAAATVVPQLPSAGEDFVVHIKNIEMTDQPSRRLH